MRNDSNGVRVQEKGGGGKEKERREMHVLFFNPWFAAAGFHGATLPGCVHVFKVLLLRTSIEWLYA